MKKNMSTVTKVTFKEDLKYVHGYSDEEADSILNTVFNTMFKGLADGRNVRINKVGTLKPSPLNSRKGINPQTKDKITIPEQVSIRFRIGMPLKSKLDENKEELLKKLKQKSRL